MLNTDIINHVSNKVKINISRLALYFSVNFTVKYSPSSEFVFYIYIHIIIPYVYILIRYYISPTRIVYFNSRLVT